jgi:hypothetical protein
MMSDLVEIRMTDMADLSDLSNLSDMFMISKQYLISSELSVKGPESRALTYRTRLALRRPA